MKRALSLLLALVLCLSLCACGGDGNEGTEAAQPKGIALTLDNYDDYLELRAYVFGDTSIETRNNYWLGAYYSGYKLIHNDFYTSYSGGLQTTVASPNFIYQDVSSTIRYTGTIPVMSENSDPDDPEFSNYSFDFEYTFELNAGGATKNDGKSSPINFPSGMLMVNDFSRNYDESFNPQYSYEIVGSKGTVIPA